MSDLKYPLSDRGESTIQFSAFNSSDPTDYFGSVELYCPPNVTVGDSMNYGDVSLGVFGSQGAREIAETMKGGGGIGDLYSAIEQQAGNTISTASGGLKKYLISLAASNLGLEAEVTSLLMRKVKSPNTHTLFQGVNIRSFSFTFRMVAEEKSESDQIQKIIDFLRANSYPELAQDTGFKSILKFPPLWSIQFLFNGNENPYMPTIDYCFLQGVDTVYNTQETSFFQETGAPFDVSVALTFTEAKPQNKNSLNERSIPISL